MVAKGGATKRDRGDLAAAPWRDRVCVLALLAEEERYGFELVQKLAGEDALVTTEGTLYPLLGRLRREGPWRRPGGSRRPDRRGATTG